MHPIVFLPLFITVIIVISSCTAQKGRIIINESPNGTEFTMNYGKLSAKHKCELSLNKGDVLQIEVICEEGEISLEIRGKNGSQPYTGNNLKPGVFTVTVSEQDEYVFQVKGNDATGKIIVKNLGSQKR